MNTTFYKYQGAGNDFILFDNRDGKINPDNQPLFQKLCHRRFGIGADGVMLLQNAKGYDFDMIYYNADGNQGSMCGNGGRCIVAFAHHLGLFAQQTKFMAVDGEHLAEINSEGNYVSLKMIDVDHIARDGEDYVLDTGSPHYVKMVNNLANYNVYQEGYNIRNNGTYKAKGINVNFVEKTHEGFFVRTFERGVEDETLACGTGVTAVALAMAQQFGIKNSTTTKIKVLGGDLQVKYSYNENIFQNIYLEGPAEFVFKGEIKLQ